MMATLLIKRPTLFASLVLNRLAFVLFEELFWLSKAMETRLSHGIDECSKGDGLATPTKTCHF
uniref:Uncharacterized protein n=1 Tax=Vibrio splendidus TaxID=29497 RepID=A0A0H3ZQ07_VIBSP|nr:hypothetical protein [Vibrio splendidus]